MVIPSVALLSALWAAAGGLEAPVLGSDEAEGGDPSMDQRLEISVHRHRPCTAQRHVRLLPPARNTLRFPSIRHSPIRRGSETGCYRVGGRARLSGPLSGNVSVWSEVRFALRGRPEPCQDFDNATQCGGFGSCLHCNACQRFEEETERAGIAHAGLWVGGAKATCEDSWEAGELPAAFVEFCLPTKRAFLKAQGLSARDFDALIDSKATEGKRQRLPLFLTLLLFQDDVSPLLAAKREREEEFRQAAGPDIYPPGSAVPEFISKETNLAAALGRRSIGCHRLYANIILPKAAPPPPS